MQYVLFIIKYGDNEFLVASKISKEALIDLFNSKSLMNFVSFLESSPLVSYVHLNVLGVRDADNK